MMRIECMCCGRKIGEKPAGGGRERVTSGICDTCLDLHYPEYADRVRAMRGEPCLLLAS